MIRDRAVLIATTIFVVAVLFGYGWILATDNSFSRIDFGITPMEAAGLPSYLEGHVDVESALGRWASGESVVGIRNFMRDEFVGFDRILTGYSAAVTAANDRFYRVAWPESPLVPMGIGSAGMFLYRGEDSLVRASPGNGSFVANVPKYVAASKRLAEAHPDVDFVFFGVTPWGMTDAARKAGYQDASADIWGRFATDMNGSVGAGLLDVSDWSDYFFATDHHWKPYGAFQGYLAIGRLLRQQDPDLQMTPLVFSEKVVDEVDFRGSSARKAGYLGLTEPFRVLTTRDPRVHAYVDGEPRDDVIAPPDYFPEPPNRLFQNHYSTYNGVDYSQIEYRTGVAGNGNLLIFGDSFSNSMEDLLAASFGNTYRVDLRYYQPETGKPFDLEKFIEDKHITHVVFLSRPASVMQMPLALEEKRPL